MEFNYKLAVRFVSDYKLPITICSEPDIFNYELDLYEKDFGSRTKWNKLLENIELHYNGNVEAFLEEFYAIRENIITSTEASEEYKAFINSKNDYKADIPESKNKNSIYNQENIGKEIISIDMNKANFQALQFAGVVKEKTYNEFLSKFASGFMLEYLQNSKYLRQVIFGHMSPKNCIKIEKYLMSKLYHDIINKIYPSDVLYFGSDEIILESNNNEKLYNELKDSILNSDIDLKIEKFIIKGYEFYTKRFDGTEIKLGEFYKRSCDESGKYKGIPLPYHKILYRLLSNETISDYDRIIMYDKCHASIIDDIFIREIKK